MLEHHHKPCRTSPKRRLQLGAIVWLAYLARVTSLTAQAMWRDEVDQWRFALSPWPELWHNFTRIGWNGPLYSPMLRLWIMVAGDSVYALRYFSLLWGVASVALVYALAKRLLDHKTGLVAASLFAFSPYMIWYAQEVKMYTWVPWLVLLALYALEKTSVAAQRWRWWAVVLLALVALIYSHILGPLLIPIILIWFILNHRRNPHLWWGLGLMLLALLLASIPLLRWQRLLLFQTRETGFPHYRLDEMALMLLNGWGAGIYQAGLMGGNLGTYAMTLWSLLAIIGLVRVGLKHFGTLLKLLVWLLLPFFALWLVSLWSPLFADRYLIWLAPAFYLFVASGILAFRNLERWAAPSLLALILVFNMLIIQAQIRHPIKPQFPEAVAYLQRHREANSLLLFQIPYNHHVVAYYAPELLETWAEAPYTNWRQPDGAYQVGQNYVDEHLSAMVEGHSDVWLVYSEVTQWDERELVRLWLDTHGRLVDVQHFTGVSLYRYSLAFDEATP